MKLSKVNCKYGAPMGRSGLNLETFATRAEGEQCKVALVHVRLYGDYDSGGAYWGSGEPLYHAYFHDNDGDLNETFFRARAREQAKKQLIELEPSLKFYR